MKKLIVCTSALITLSAFTCCGKSRHKEKQEAQDTTATATFNASSNEASIKAVKFARLGGGNIEYYLTLQEDSINVHVTKRQFRETDYQMAVAKNELDSAVVNTLDRIIKKEIDFGVQDTVQSSGNFMCGGTWTHAYYVDDTTQTEIYDKTLVGQVTQTEDWVRNKLESLENKNSEE